MGFGPQIKEIINNSEMPQRGTRNTLMFSATFPNDIQQLAMEFLQDKYLFLTVGRVGGTNADVAQVCRVFVCFKLQTGALKTSVRCVSCVLSECACVCELCIECV